MKGQRFILYLGSDEEFFRELEKFSAKLRDVKVEKVVYVRGHLLSYCASESPPRVILVDFTSPGCDHGQLLEEVVTLKQIACLKGCLFVGLFADGTQLRKFPHMFATGFQLSSIKGGEVETLFRDCCYIGFGQSFPFPGFAKARSIQKALLMGVCSTVAYLSLEQLVVETDIELQGMLDLNLTFLPGMKDAHFKIKDRSIFPIFYPMTMTYVLEYPYSGPWDTAPGDSFQRDSMETWFNLNVDGMDQRRGFIKVISDNVTLVSGFAQEKGFPLFVDFTNKIHGGILFDFKVKKPGLIFFDIDDGENSFEKLAEIMSAVKSVEDYRPVIVASNCKSGGGALQKIFGYQFITGIPTKLEKNIFKVLTDSFIERRMSGERTAEDHYFAPSDARRSLDIMHNFIVTSLTEHEITFFSDVELPMFTVLHSMVPMDFYATIVPAFVRLESRPMTFHYMAIIHGLEEEGLKKLRQFIYQIIHKPIESFTAESVEVVMNEIRLGKVPVPVKPAGSGEEYASPKKDREAWGGHDEGFKILGKSKL